MNRTWFASVVLVFSLIMAALMAGGIVHGSLWWIVLYGFNIGWTIEFLGGGRA